VRNEEVGWGGFEERDVANDVEKLVRSVTNRS
jgi:hypothetical protein